MAVSESRGGQISRFRSRIASVCAAIAIAVPAHAGIVLFVDDDAPPGGDGQTWDTAFGRLQDALAAAQPGSGVEEIHVGQGTYMPDQDEGGNITPGDREATFDLINGISLMGGYAGFGAPDPDVRAVTLYETILSGDIGEPEAWEDNTYHVVTAVMVYATTVLDGFTITKGNADNNGEPGGGGLYVLQADPVLRGCRFLSNSCSPLNNLDGGGAGAHVAGGRPHFDDCEFRENRGHGAGAGLFNRGDCYVTDCVFRENEALYGSGRMMGGGFFNAGGSPRLVGCWFEDNEAARDGGAVAGEDGAMQLINCTFVNNEGDDGGAVGSTNGNPILIGCRFQGNWSHDYGGGLAHTGGVALIMACDFVENIAADDGGGMLLGTDGMAANCRFFGNEAADGGGARIYKNTAIVNSLFVGNEAEDKAGAVRMEETASLVNCTIVGNTAPVSGGIYFGPDNKVTDCILWNNGGSSEHHQIGCDGSGCGEINYCAVQGWTGGFGGTGNIGGDPMFADPDGPDDILGTEDDDLRLLAGSSCIDAADNTAVAVCILDLDGHERFVDDPATDDTGFGDPPIVDMGVYEFPGAAGDTDCNNNLLADLCEIAEEITPDCNLNDVPDECDIASEISEDCNQNVIPDECETALLDCNENGVPDDCDIAFGGRPDCNLNGVPDECDIASGFSDDCNANDVPDECEPDCNGNGVADECDIDSGCSEDVNLNGIPDECENIYNSSQGTYYSTITLALEDADEGEEILVSPGTYYELIDFQGKGVALRGAEGPEVTILDGEFQGQVVLCVNDEGPDTILDGFTITGGWVDDQTGCYNGAGMCNLDSSPTIRNCIFVGNIADHSEGAGWGYGGGMFNGEDSSPTIMDCLFLNNEARMGGGVYNDDDSNTTFLRCVFMENVAQHNDNGAGLGGGTFNRGGFATYEDCSFTRNSASGWVAGLAAAGGGGMAGTNAYVTLRNCEFTGNMSGRGGGALSCVEGRISAVNCLFHENRSVELGGGLSLRGLSRHSVFANCMIVSNSTLGIGGGIYSQNGCSSGRPRFYNCTVAHNSADSGGGFFRGNGIVEFVSCILWGNSPDQIDGSDVDDPMPIVFYSDVQDGYPGYGNLDVDPLFTNPGAQDMHLLPGSPCIDAGDPTPLDDTGLTDIDGDPRFQSCRIDIGADETGALGSDCNENGVSDGCDLLEELGDDCDRDGVPDECELAADPPPDCDQDGLIDVCETSKVHVSASGRRSPFDGYDNECLTIIDPPQASGDVFIDLIASAEDNFVFYLNDVDLDVVAADCGPVSSRLIVDREYYNQVVMDQDATFCMERNSSGDCPGSFISFEVTYLIEPADEDCNYNGRPDACDLDDGISDDCNDNGEPDDCDVLHPINEESGDFSPFGWDSPATYTIASAPQALEDVVMVFTAYSDLSASSECVEVSVNSVNVGTIFETGGSDCPEFPDKAELVVPMGVFNAAMADQNDAAITMTASGGVNGEQCDEPSFISVAVRYLGHNDNDVNHNGIPDECECPADVNGDGKVNIDDLFGILGAWGTCDDCPEDINADGVVNIDDLFEVLAEWGPCP